MAEHAITLTPAERDGATRLVRVAVECPQCEGIGEVTLPHEDADVERWECHGTGHFPAPYQPGDVLVHEWEEIHHEAGWNCVCMCESRYTVVSVELVQEDGEWVWVYEVSK